MASKESASISDAKYDREEQRDVHESYLPVTEEEKAFERKTVFKVDMRLLLILGALYSISIIDRTNLSSARVAGMAAELKLTVGERYSIVTLVFFIPYIIFEIPSNLLLRRLGARNLICGLTAAWGAVMIGMGFVDTWGQLAVLRTLLGFFEAGFFPACVFLIQTWYTRFETQKRMAVFYLTSTVIAGFSGLLAYGLTQLHGKHGLSGWRWIFIVEGAMTVGLALIGALLIVDFPDKNKFLTPEQTKLMIDRVNADRGDAMPDQLTLSKALKHFADWRIWAFAFCFMSSTVASYAFSYFLPVILQGGGYSTLLSLALPAPVYVFGGIWTFATAWASDRYKIRAPFIALSAIICLVGLVITGYAKTIGVRFFGSFLVIGGCQANIPAVLAYSANNVLSHSKRAISSAVVIGMGGVGGILASTVYRQVDFPRYLNGLWTTIGCQLLILVLITALTLDARRQNKLADEGRKVIEGDERFRYTI